MKKHRLPAAVLALAALGFTLGTCEFVIVGILPDIAPLIFHNPGMNCGKTALSFAP